MSLGSHVASPRHEQTQRQPGDCWKMVAGRALASSGPNRIDCHEKQTPDSRSSSQRPAEADLRLPCDHGLHIKHRCFGLVTFWTSTGRLLPCLKLPRDASLGWQATQQRKHHLQRMVCDRPRLHGFLPVARPERLTFSVARALQGLHSPLFVAPRWCLANGLEDLATQVRRQASVLAVKPSSASVPCPQLPVILYVADLVPDGEMSMDGD